MLVLKFTINPNIQRENMPHPFEKITKPSCVFSAVISMIFKKLLILKDVLILLGVML